MEPRPIFAALGLFFGGLVVGSAGGGSREGNAHAATTSPDAKSERGASPTSRGPLSPALRRTAASASGSTPGSASDLDVRGLSPSQPSGGRCSTRMGARRADASRADDALQGLKLPALPIQRPALVMEYVQYFTENDEGRKNFAEALRRSGRFEEIIAKAMRERGLPAELAAVALVESGFTVDAVSPAGATGLWQFMPATARAYGLRIDREVDERTSIWASTKAAAHHLADLYERFRSWDLALAAYNLGYEGLERRLEDAEADDFWTLADLPDALPKETATYVPKVLAAAIVLQNLDELGFGDVERRSPVDAGELEVASGTPLALVARAAGTSVHVLRELNPELLTDAAPDRGERVTLHVPRAGTSRARVMLPKLVAEPDDQTLRVSDDFDWGKDDVQVGRSHLERTATSGTRHRRSRTRTRRHSPAIEPATAKAKLAEPMPRERAPSERVPSEPMPAKAARSVEPALAEAPKPTERHEEPESPAPSPAAAALPAPTHRDATPTPAPAAAAAAAEDHVFYRVVPGDSVAQIAATVGLTVDQLLAQAHVTSADQIKVGALLDLHVPKDGVSETRRPLAR